MLFLAVFLQLSWIGKLYNGNSVILLKKQNSSMQKKGTKAFVDQFRRFINTFNWAKRM